ncbi:MAG: N4-gp56 family major capsid protein [Pseudomonadota bacterium]
MGVSTTNNIGPEVDKYWDGVLLDRDKQWFSHLLFGQVRKIPMKNSSTLVARKYDNFDDTPATLTEGVTPALEDVTKNDIEISLQQFGKAIALSDRVHIEVQDETSEEVADMLSQNMFAMLDKVTRNTLFSTATQFDSVNGVATPINGVTEMTETDLDDVLDHLFGNNALRMTPMLDASTGIQTSPIDASYWAILHSDLRKDLEALSSFVRRSQYSDPRAALQNELGSTDYIRWVYTTEAKKETSNIYSNFIFGQNAYAMADIDDVATEMIIKPLGFGEDYLNQRQTMGWKSMYGAGIIDDGKMANLRAIAST